MTDGAIFAASALSLILAVSAWGKLRAPANFRRALGTFKIIPKGAVPLLLVGVPITELSLASLQWVPGLRPAVGIAMIVMFVSFTLLLLRSLLKGEEADCGCFGSAAPEKVSWFSIVRNLVLIGFAVMGLMAGDGAARGTLPAALSGVGAGVLVLVLDQGLALFSRTWFTPERIEG
jgi:hypothetical protein